MYNLNPLPINNTQFKIFSTVQVVGTLAGTIVCLSMGIPIVPSVSHVLLYINCLLRIPFITHRF